MTKQTGVLNMKSMRNMVACRKVECGNFNIRDDETVFSRGNINQLLQNWWRFYRHKSTSTEIWAWISNYVHKDGT